MSLGSSRDCSTASAIYLAVPYWKSQVEASSKRGAPSTSIRGAQTGVVAWWSAFLSPSVADLVCIVRGCLAALWCSVSRGGKFFPPSITFFPLSSLYLFGSAGSVQRGWVGGGGGVGSLVWGALVGACLPGWNSKSFWNVDLGFLWIPISSSEDATPSKWLGRGWEVWPRSPGDVSGDKGWSKTS